MSLELFFNALEEAKKEVDLLESLGFYEQFAIDQRRYRIRLSLAAYAYEFHDSSIMTDAEFDELSSKVDVNVDTGNQEMDKFFRDHFDSSTGQWIWNHPELDKIEWIYKRYFERN